MCVKLIICMFLLICSFPVMKMTHISLMGVCCLAMKIRQSKSPHCEVCSWAEHPPHHQLHQFAPSLLSSWHHLCSCSRTLWTSCLDLCVFTSSTCCHCISITFVDIYFLLISFTPTSPHWITGLYYINLCTY